MFSQNDQEKKLDWMYKGPNSMVNREDYLLGRPIDKSLEQLNTEEKQKQLGIVPPKNRVEHECIPPSIRDFNKIVLAEQVDLSTKLQEDPLVAIKKHEEECRREFLQNPVQLKKLQKALKAQEEKKSKTKKNKRNKHKKHKHDDEEDDDDDLDTILIHKFNQFKDKLTEEDMREILGIEDEDNSNSKDNESKERKKSKEKHKKYSESLSSSSSESDTQDTRDKKRRNWGLTKSDGSKLTLKSSSPTTSREKGKTIKDNKTTLYRKEESKNMNKRLTEDEKERKRREMMRDAADRDQERSRNLKRHREIEEKESKQLENFDREFAHKQYIQSTKNSTVESRIKSNINKIQRSGRDMDKHFSRRH